VSKGSVKLHPREIDGLLIFDLTGRIVLGPELATLQDSVEAGLKKGHKRQILNLKQVSTIDSSGLGTLVFLHTTLAGANGDLKLLHLSEKHLELLVLTKLTGVFEIFDDEQEAINSFYPERKVRRFDILQFVKEQENREPTIGEPVKE
jgi:anti-sigma B factor antagonist